jgi:hypothetical protein
MRNPVPKQFRRPLNSLLLFVLVYLAMTGLHAMIDGRAKTPPTFLILAFAAGALIAVWIRGMVDGESGPDAGQIESAGSQAAAGDDPGRRS